MKRDWKKTGKAISDIFYTKDVMFWLTLKGIKAQAKRW